MSIGRFSVLEILDARAAVRFTLPCSGRIAKPRILVMKEIYTDICYDDIKYDIDYARAVPRRILLKEWNGSYTNCVFK